MTADRDALINLLTPHLGGQLRPGTIGHEAAGWEAGKLADVILGAGWRALEVMHRHEWEPAGYLLTSAVTGHPLPPHWVCACGAFRHGAVDDAVDDYKQARGAAKLDRPAEEIIREGRGE